MFHYRYHIFCCQNEREPENLKGCCRDKGSAPLLDFFKKTVYEAGLKNSVRVTSAGCLGACRFGPSLVVYPEGVWYTLRGVEEAGEVFEKHILGGKPVEKYFMKNTPEEDR